MRLEFTDFEALSWFLDAIVQPTSTDFAMYIKTEWSDAKLIYLVEIPQEHDITK